MTTSVSRKSTRKSKLMLKSGSCNDCQLDFLQILTIYSAFVALQYQLIFFEDGICTHRNALADPVCSI